LVKRIYPFFDEVNSTGTAATIALQLKDRVRGPITITDTQTYTLGQTNRFTTHYRRGRLGQAVVTFTSSNGGFGTQMTLDGYDFDLPMGSPGGQR
jgi:hypothetical protein